MAHFNHKLKEPIRVFYNGNRPVSAVGILRKMFDCTLGEAKEAVEANYMLMSEDDFYRVVCRQSEYFLDLPDYGWTRGQRHKESVVHSFGNIKVK